ncbi:MAG: CAP domain-containing protein [Burkholderiaceae bacterium]
MKQCQPTGRAFGLATPALAALSAIAILALSSCGGGGLARSRSVSDDVAQATSQTASQPASQTMTKVDATCGLSNFQAEMLAQINARRAAGAVCGAKKMSAAGSLAWNAQLHHAATLHALNMATTGVYTHTGPNGWTLPQRANAAGYNYALLGENIDAQRTSVHAAINSWMNSPNHCENIMRTQFRDIGVSCVSNSASQWGNYWTMALGAR